MTTSAQSLHQEGRRAKYSQLGPNTFIGTKNICSMNETLRLPRVTREMYIYILNILGVSVCWWTHFRRQVTTWRFNHPVSGHTDKHIICVVALVISKGNANIAGTGTVQWYDNQIMLQFQTLQTYHHSALRTIQWIRQWGQEGLVWIVTTNCRQSATTWHMCDNRWHECQRWCR